MKIIFYPISFINNSQTSLSSIPRYRIVMAGEEWLAALKGFEKKSIYP